jgi:hypothetical protein
LAARLRWLTSFLLLLAFASSASSIEGAQQAKGRWHFAFLTEPRFEISVLFSRDESGDKTRLLVRLPSGRWDLYSEQDPTSRVTFETVKDMETGASLERRLFLPGPKLPPACARTPGDACIVFKGEKGERRLAISAFSGEKGNSERQAVKALLAPGLEAALKRLLDVFPRSHEFDAYGDDFLYLVWPAGRRTGPVEQAKRSPGCAFDASFGYPCSEADQKREQARFKKPD